MRRSDVTFKVGGDVCAAWLYEPGVAGATAGPGVVPCVVMAHGFGSTRRDGLTGYAETFAAAGFAVLLFDYRGFGDSGGRPRELLNVRRQLEDWRAALDYARGLPVVDPARLALWGTSFSGGHVVTVAADDPRVAAVIVQAPFADGIPTALTAPLGTTLRIIPLVVRDLLAASTGGNPVYLPCVGRPGSVAAMTTPDAEPGMRGLAGPDSRWRNRVAARSVLQIPLYRPVRRAASLSMPVLICVASEDRVTPPGPARRLARLAPRAELRQWPIGHFDIYYHDAVKAAQLDFLTRHLAG